MERDVKYENTDPTVYESPFSVNNSLYSFSLTVPSLLMDSKSQKPVVFLHTKNFLWT